MLSRLHMAQRVIPKDCIWGLKTSSKCFILCFLPCSGGICMGNLAMLSSEVSWEQSCKRNIMRKSSSNRSSDLRIPAIILSKISNLTGNKHHLALNNV